MLTGLYHREYPDALGLDGAPAGDEVPQSPADLADG